VRTRRGAQPSSRSLPNRLRQRSDDWPEGGKRGTGRTVDGRRISCVETGDESSTERAPDDRRVADECETDTFTVCVEERISPQNRRTQRSRFHPSKSGRILTSKLSLRTAQNRACTFCPSTSDATNWRKARNGRSLACRRRRARTLQ
jgi:hypothetical protein